MPQLAAHVLLICIVAASILLMLLRPRGIAEVYWVGGGVLLLLALRLIPLHLAAHAAAKGTDVYLFLAGMMLLSELARETGIFDWISSIAVRHARSSGRRLFFLLYLAGICVTVCMSNDATAVVLTPAVLASVRRARIDPLPFLFACAMVANAASFVLPISNPANLVVFHSSLPPLPQWLIAFLVPSVLSIATTFAVLRFYFRRQLHASIATDLQPAELSSDGKLVLIGIGLVVAVLLIASAFGKDLGLPTLLAALAITAVSVLHSRVNPLRLAKEISWATLALVAALFIMVDSVESAGALSLTHSAFLYVQRLGPSSGAFLTAFTVGVGNNLINNLPMGLLAANTLSITHAHGLLANTVLIAVDLGPNLAVSGSLATILWLLALRREGLNVRFRDFLKVGIFAMPAALLLSIAGLLSLHSLLSK
ncbi:MAG TPA: SLC13 family permease [Acidobacteriaceae bacterium]|jgi:arsenical pump membrane protein|nr:SLC13 family permease [Acidobacteriaceae bacterium]